MTKIHSISLIYSRPVNLLFRHNRKYYHDLSKTLPFLIFPLHVNAERTGKIDRKLNASLKQCESKMKLKCQRGFAKDCLILVCAHRFSRSFLT